MLFPLASGGFLAIFGIPWQVQASPNPCLHVHMAFSLCVCLIHSSLSTHEQTQPRSASLVCTTR